MHLSSRLDQAHIVVFYLSAALQTPTQAFLLTLVVICLIHLPLTGVSVYWNNKASLSRDKPLFLALFHLDELIIELWLKSTVNRALIWHFPGRPRFNTTFELIVVKLVLPKANTTACWSYHLRYLAACNHLASVFRTTTLPGVSLIFSLISKNRKKSMYPCQLLFSLFVTFVWY